MSKVLGLFLCLLALAPRGGYGQGKKASVDGTKPVRLEVFHRILAPNGEELGRALESSRLVLDPQVREWSFTRVLLDFADGTRAAFYLLVDFSSTPGQSRVLLVNAKNGEWVLVRTEQRTKMAGWQAARQALKENLPTFLGLETRRLRISREGEEAFAASNLPQLFVQAEPELVAWLQDLRRRFGPPPPADLSGWEGLRALPDELARVLQLPEVPYCQCQLERVRHQLVQDLPDQPGKPLAPDLEDAFGRWASWGELPRLRQ
ncbi:MAG: hypothetical protein NZ869_01020 [Thermoanaerobaculum sp.]|nr:hypothetical protein [Thermoanaerobaculum sp.]MDW7967698.1 hypothetical protein [Thermoanaerobaculum sp.]